MNKPLLLTLEYPPQIGGVGKYLEAEVDSFAGHVDIVNVRRFFWGLWPKWLPLLLQTKKLFKYGDYDVLWISHILPLGYIGLFLGLPYRLYLHGLDIVLPLQSAWKKYWVKKILTKAQEVVVNSQATAQLLKKYGFDPGMAQIQYPRIADIQTDAYRDVGRQLRQKHNIGNRPILLTISRLVKRKGIDLVIKALPKIWLNVPDLVYVIVGAGNEKSNLEKMSVSLRASLVSDERGEAISKSAVSDNEIAAVPRICGVPRNDTVIFAGGVSDEEKYAWLSACDCFILTPRDDPNDFEGYGIVYKEAQMFGKPVIGARVGGVPEAIGDNGVLIKPNDIEQISSAVTSILNEKKNQKNQNK